MRFYLCQLVAVAVSPIAATAAPVQLLNVSYDPTRELYKDINAAFAQRWQAQPSSRSTIRQSHGGSGKQARSVIDGLPADVVTLALAYDIDEIAQRAKLIAPNWQTRLPQQQRALLFDDRVPGPQGQPEEDQRLGRSHPAGRQGHHAQPEDQRRRALELSRGVGLRPRRTTARRPRRSEFMTRLFRNVPVLDSGARGATTTFVQRGQGDVLLAWENEAFLAVNELGKGKFDIVVPSVSILAEPPVAVVDKVVDKQGHAERRRGLSQISSTRPRRRRSSRENYYRPRNAQVAAQVQGALPEREAVHDRPKLRRLEAGAGQSLQRRRRCSTRFSKTPSARRCPQLFNIGD